MLRVYVRPLQRQVRLLHLRCTLDRDIINKIHRDLHETLMKLSEIEFGD